MPTGGFAWGTTWKFPTYIGDYSFDTMNNTGEDRMVKATLPITTKATLMPETELRADTFQKRFSVKKISFKSETQTFNVNVVDPPPGGYERSNDPSPLVDRLSNSKNRLA